jgi:hypothetical protein
MALVATVGRDLVAEYCRVLQEESERVCRTALPLEMVWLILFRWGGMQTLTARLIRKQLGTCAVMLDGSRVRMPSTIRLSCDLKGQRAYTYRHHMTGLATCYTYPVYSASYGYDVTQVDINTDNNHFMDMLVYTGVPEYWQAAAECRGLSVDYWMSSAIARCFMPPFDREGRRDMYRLLLRAETDPSWRFWVDLFWPRQISACRNDDALSSLHRNINSDCGGVCCVDHLPGETGSGRAELLHVGCRSLGGRWVAVEGGSEVTELTCT